MPAPLTVETGLRDATVKATVILNVSKSLRIFFVIFRVDAVLRSSLKLDLSPIFDKLMTSYKDGLSLKY